MKLKIEESDNLRNQQQETQANLTSLQASHFELTGKYAMITSECKKKSEELDAVRVEVTQEKKQVAELTSTLEEVKDQFYSRQSKAEEEARNREREITLLKVDKAQLEEKNRSQCSELQAFKQHVGVSSQEQVNHLYISLYSQERMIYQPLYPLNSSSRSPPLPRQWRVCNED